MVQRTVHVLTQMWIDKLSIGPAEKEKQYFAKQIPNIVYIA